MRSKRLKNTMLKEDLDALVAISPENVLYSTGANIKTQRYLRERLAISVLSENKDDSLIICSLEDDGVRKQTWVKDIRSYIEFKESPIELLVDLIIERGLEKGRIGIETHYLTAYFYKQLLELLPYATFVECSDVFNKVRMLKEPDEIKLLVKIAKIAEKAVTAAFLMSKPGNSELQLANQIIFNQLNQGIEEIPFMFLGSGKKSSLLHPIPGEDVIMDTGDLIRLDFGGFLSGYWSDIARTVIIKKASSVQQDTYKKLILIHNKIFQKIKIGVRICDIYNYAKKIYNEMNVPFIMPLIGHGLGLECHEYPIINPYNKEKIQENMIINIELIIINENLGYQIENLIYIDANGPNLITGIDTSDKLPLIC